MKKIIFICLIASFYSCKKCAICTRTWKVHSYQYHTSNNGISYTDWTNDYDGTTEIFEVCGGGDIDNAEKEIKRNSTIPVGTGGRTFIVSEEIGNCACK